MTAALHTPLSTYIGQLDFEYMTRDQWAQLTFSHVQTLMDEGNPNGGVTVWEASLDCRPVKLVWGWVRDGEVVMQSDPMGVRSNAWIVDADREVLPRGDLLTHFANAIFKAKWAEQVARAGQVMEVRKLLPQPSSPLTDQEREALYWSMIGKSAAETAIIMGKSHHTVGGYIKISCEKLYAKNKNVAVMNALRLGLISEGAF